MLKNLIFSLVLLLPLSSQADDLSPFSDNILFAFDKCRSFSLDLKKTAIVEVESKPFDIHCVQANTDKELFKCDYFDTASNKKGDLENLSGGKSGKIGILSSKGGTSIRFSMEKGSASFEAPVASADGLENTRKLCVGIFLFEKDALKRKK